MSTIPTSTGNIIPGTPGNDFLNLPPSGVGFDTLVGLQGDDTLLAGLGSGAIFGGKGNDSIVGGIAGSFVRIFGDEGNDTITAGTFLAASPLTANGGPGDDSIVGGDQGDSLRGGKDNDTIIGNGGADTIYGDNGNDLIVGGATGNFPGEAGNFINGNQGDDTIYGAEGNDTMRGGRGNDMINVDPAMLPQALRSAVVALHVAGDNDIYGDLGNDTIGWSASTGRGYYDGGEGDDSLIGGLGNRGTTGDRVRQNVTRGGSLGEDLPAIQSGNDSLLGGDGNDTLRGSGGNNTLIGGAGNDYLYSGLDRDTLTGGEGVDRFVYDRSTIEYNTTARTDLGARVTTGTLQARLDRADRITDFNPATTGGDLIRIQSFTSAAVPASGTTPAEPLRTVFGEFTGVDRGQPTTLALNAGQLGISPGDPDTTFGAANAALTGAALTNRLVAQEFYRNTVRAEVLTTPLLGVEANSIVVYIERDFTLVSPTNTAVGGVGGQGTTDNPFSLTTTGTNFGLSEGDTVLAVLQAPTGATAAQLTSFVDNFVNRGAGNFEFFA